MAGPGPGQLQKVNVTRPGSAGAAHAEPPSISPDGRYVAFRSPSTNLVAGATNYARKNCNRDLMAGTTFLFSQNPSPYASFRPVFSPEGNRLLLPSASEDFQNGLDSQGEHLFTVALSAIVVTDSDLDGPDDDWEWQSFGCLARDGSLDLDLDGFSDRAEFQAGTDPN